MVTSNLNFYGNRQANVAVQLIVTGQAGLESGPFFLEAIENSNLLILEPWAVDQDRPQYQKLVEETRVRNVSRGIEESAPRSWKRQLLQTAGQEDTIKGIKSHLGLDDILKLETSEDYLCAGHPQVIRCATNLMARQWGDELIESLLNCPPAVNQLLVIFVYNPDGQTSGTAAVELAQSLRRRLNERQESPREEALRQQLQRTRFVGIELCTSDPANQGELANTLCGYVRRKEIHDLMDKGHKPFDLIITVDGFSASQCTPRVDFPELDSKAAELVRKIVSGELIAMEPLDVIDLLMATGGDRVKSAMFDIGFSPGEVSRLEILDARRRGGFLGLFKSGHRRRYQAYLRQFGEWKREPYRSCPPLTARSLTGLLRGETLSVCASEEISDAIERDFRQRLALYYFRRRFKEDSELLKRIVIFQRSHEANNRHRPFAIDTKFLYNVVDIGNVASMSNTEVRSAVQRIFTEHLFNDNNLKSQISYAVFAGPASIKDVGAYGTYESYFNESLDDDQNFAIMKQQIAYPEFWADVLKKKV